VTEERISCDVIELQNFVSKFFLWKFLLVFNGTEKNYPNGKFSVRQGFFVLAFLFSESGSGIITPTLQHANWNISPDARLRTFASATSSFFFNINVKPKYKVRVSFFQAPSQNCEKRLLASCLSVRPSVRSHGTTRLPLDGFSWNLIFDYFSRIFWGNSSLIKIR
jgi:hypothetical protein